MYAGILRQSAFLPATAGTRHTKVKAHQELEGLQGEELRRAQANQMADLRAKLATEFHPEVPKGIWQAAARTETCSKTVLSLATQLLKLWPRLGVHQRKPKPEAD